MSGSAGNAERISARDTRQGHFKGPHGRASLPLPSLASPVVSPVASSFISTEDDSDWIFLFGVSGNEIF
jgi:hypothetical protein